MKSNTLHSPARGRVDASKTETVLTQLTEHRVIQTLVAIVALCLLGSKASSAESRPNILFCISDDQSYAHTGANGDPVIKTPTFDRVAREGLRFTHAFCDAPTCGPSRSAILTGQHIWRLEEAGNIHSTLPVKFATYTELLADAGYAVGYTGKGWSPGRLEPGGREDNPAGELFNRHRLKPPFKGMSNLDYAGNFQEFLKQVSKNQPFCFWLGTSEPHRGYQAGAGKRTGKDPANVIVPPIFPDNEVVRSDILDYFVEVEHFDSMVARAIAALEARGDLDNTLIVVTSDHGMPFPRAKASLYDAGSRVPLAIRWPKGIANPGRNVKAFVNLSDLAPTFLEVVGLKIPEMMTARSLVEIFAGNNSSGMDAAFIAMERHDGCRKGGKGYPCRAIRTEEYLYIHNFEPTRWPSGKITITRFHLYSHHLAWPCRLPGSGQGKRPPNVVVFLVDDLGPHELVCYASRFHDTPNIDALAGKGMRFTHAYSGATLCSPSRAALLTGRSPARLHLTDWIPGQVQINRKTLTPDWQTPYGAEVASAAPEKRRTELPGRFLLTPRAIQCGRRNRARRNRVGRTQPRCEH